MTVREYVIQQLSDYNKTRKDIIALEFELKSLAPFNLQESDNVIESMTFAHPVDELVQGSHISDKTASIALNYHSVSLQQTQEARQQICRRLEAYTLQVRRLDTYLAILPEENAAVLRQHYFDGCSWQEIADTGHNCLRTVKKRREMGIARLVELYSNLSAMGRLPGISP